MQKELSKQTHNPTKEKFTDSNPEMVSKIVNNKPLFALLSVIIFTVISRIKYFSSTSIWNDAAVHLGYSLKFLQNPLFLFSKEYLTHDYITIQTLTAIVQIFTQNILLSGKLIALLFALLGVIGAYFLGKELKNEVAGIIASVLLTTQYLFFFYSTRPLSDAPLASMFIFTIYTLVHAYKHKSKKWSILAGIMILLTIATKTPGVILLIGLLIYLAIAKRKEMIKEHILYSWAIPTGSIVIFGLLALAILKENIFARLFASFFNFAGITTGLDAVSLLPSIITIPVIILTIIGIIFAKWYNTKEYLLPIIIMITFQIWFEVGVRSTLDRYLLPLIPMFIIFTAIAITELGTLTKTVSKNKWIGLAVIIIITAVIANSAIDRGYALTDSKKFTYTGYFEAADFLTETMEENAVLIAGSYRPMTAFTVKDVVEVTPDLTTKDIQGKAVNLRAPKYIQEDGKTQFEKDLNILKSLKLPLYLEIDVWEYTQPSWYYQISMQSIEYFQNQGFEVINVINMPVQEGAEPQSVVFLFKYAPQQ